MTNTQSDNAPKTACLGGWCAQRDKCGRHVTDDRRNVSERLCAVGHETPEPVLVAGGVDLAPKTNPEVAL